MKIQSLFIASTLIVMTTTAVTATTFPTTTTPFSKYGQIQNVQNYSSNPFWDPSSPYNQRMPVPVYVQGTDVDTSDCTTIVGALVSSFCTSRNNCAGLSLDDVRPTIMVQLASLPNHNYVTPCAGYVDSEFSKYVAQNTLAAPTDTPVAFPNATAPNTDLNKQEYELQNPYNPKLPTWNGEPWMQDMLERKQELQNLQSASATSTGAKLASAEFPQTANDLTFSQRIENDAAGYAPYAGKSAYRTIKIENEETYKQRTNAYCGREIAKLSVIDADLATLQKCKQANTPFNDCKKQLRGIY